LYTNYVSANSVSVTLLYVSLHVVFSVTFQCGIMVIVVCCVLTSSLLRKQDVYEFLNNLISCNIFVRSSYKLLLQRIKSVSLLYTNLIDVQMY
jgi:hypothetical protein